MPLLRRYKNNLLRILRDHDFDPSLFEVSEATEAAPTWKITLRGSPLFFRATNDEDNYHCFDYEYSTFSASFSLYTPQQHDINAYRLPASSLYSAFGVWLKEHVRIYLEEIVEPDLWQDYLSEIREFTQTDSGALSLEKFANDEKAVLRFQLKEFETLVISKLELDDTQASLISNRLEYVSAALDRLNRFDWRGVLINTLIAVAIALSLDSSRGSQLIQLFKKVFFKVVYLLR